jgi:Mitochondrial inner membrane protein
LEAGVGKYIFLLSPFLIGGGVAAYAKQDPEFRKTLVKNAPAVEPTLSYLLGEKKPFEEFGKTLDGYKSTVTGFFGGGKEEPKPAAKSE